MKVHIRDEEVMWGDPRLERNVADEPVYGRCIKSEDGAETIAAVYMPVKPPLFELPLPGGGGGGPVQQITIYRTRLADNRRAKALITRLVERLREKAAAA